MSNLRLFIVGKNNLSIGHSLQPLHHLRHIVYILVDDIGFGDLGIPELNAVRGYETPNINELSDQGTRMVRMYTEPSCTPTRVAFMTGRQPYRMGMGDTAVDIAGFGLPGKEVTLAEVLSEAGYNT